MASKSSASFLIYCVLCLIFLIILFVSPGIAGRGFPGEESIIGESKIGLRPKPSPLSPGKGSPPP
ncbi:hypothetical protein LguiB_013590 [Lonicera macranthoides]